MTITGPIQLGTDICDALDIRADLTRTISIDVDVSSVPTITVEQFIDNGRRLAPVLRRYQLVPMPRTRIGRLKLRIIRRMVNA